jgi:cobalt-precorrin 5A hydrolase/precorrin-3B C17-methyltransferase
LGRRLPYEHRAGRLVETVGELWPAVDALVIVGAAGIAVRAVAPWLGDKRRDPAVVAVDDAGRFVIPLCGGHAGGANALAQEVAALLGAVPVITTASDGAGLPALDELPGFRAEGDVAGVTRRWLDGARPVVRVDAPVAGWPLPPGLEELEPDGAGHVTVTDRSRPRGGDEPGEPDGAGHVTVTDRSRPGGPDEPGEPDGAGLVTVTDRSRPAGPGEVLLRPASLVVGIGASRGATPGPLWELLAVALKRAGVDRVCVEAVATLDRKAAEPAILALGERLGVPVRTYEAAALAGITVPHPSEVVATAVGTPSVAEAAALLAAGPEASLVATKQVSATGDSTVAIARRRTPAGELAVVGLGPGDPALRTPAAVTAIRHASTVIGYSGYVDLVADLVRPGQRVRRSPIGAEADRCREALQRAAAGEQVALVCSGDPGVYAMASLVMELAPGLGDPPVRVVPGVTAALGAAAVLGAPLGHDHAAVSLSDLLTPWEVIARRLRAIAEGDLVVTLYNPRSSRRTTQLSAALGILAEHRAPATPAAVVTDIGRAARPPGPAAEVVRTTLAELDPDGVSMRAVVVVGASSTRWIGDRMVTPRGYPGAPR